MCLYDFPAKLRWSGQLASVTNVYLFWSLPPSCLAGIQVRLQWSAGALVLCATVRQKTTKSIEFNPSLIYPFLAVLFGLIVQMASKNSQNPPFIYSILVFGNETQKGLIIWCCLKTTNVVIIIKVYSRGAWSEEFLAGSSASRFVS